MDMLSTCNMVTFMNSKRFGTVCTAKYKKYSEEEDMPDTVVLKRFKNFDETPE